MKERKFSNILSNQPLEKFLIICYMKNSEAKCEGKDTEWQIVGNIVAIYA